MMTCMFGYELPFPELLAIQKIPLLGRWGQLFPIWLRLWSCISGRAEEQASISVHISAGDDMLSLKLSWKGYRRFIGWCYKIKEGMMVIKFQLQILFSYKATGLKYDENLL